VKTRLKYKSTELLIGFLRFLVQSYDRKTKSGKKSPKSFIYPNFGYFILTFEPETLEGQSKA